MAKYSYPVDFEGTFWTIIDGDFYVSTVGNDITGDGSPKNPFLTIHRAFELAVDGEKIVIGPDEYIRVDGTTTGVNASGSEVPCRVATTGNISLVSGGLFTIDGVLTQAGDRVLVWNQNDPTENGIFIVSANPWERADDFNNPDNIIPGKLIPILEGSQNGKEVFQLTTSGEIVVGTTPLSFEKVAISHWGEIMGDITLQSDLTNKISTDIQIAVDGLKDGVAVEGDTLKKLYDLIQGVVGVSRSVPTFADLPADGKDQESIFVQDASGDSTVTSGWAIYKSIGDQPGGSYVKIAEQEGLDIDLSQFWKTSGSTTLTGTTTIEGNNNQLNLNSGPGLTDRTSLVLNDSTPYASLSAITAGGYTSQLYVSLSQLFLTYRGSDGGPESTIALVDSGMLVIDTRNQTGLKYFDDYSSNYVDRSLVDKAYVDAQVANLGAAGNSDAIQFNDNGSLGATDDFTFSPSTGGGILAVGPGPSSGLRLSLSRSSNVASFSIHEETSGALALRISNDGGDFGAIYIYGGGALKIRFTTQGIFSFIDTGYPFGIGTNAPNSQTVLSLGGNSSITLPKGTTAQRPSTPVSSMLRFNTDTSQLEVYDGTQWVSPGTAVPVEERVMFDSNLDTVRTVYYNGVLSFGNFAFDNANDGLASIEFQTSTDGSTWTSHGTITAPGTPPAALNTWVSSNGSGNWYLRIVATYKAGAMKTTGAQWSFTR